MNLLKNGILIGEKDIPKKLEKKEVFTMLADKIISLRKKENIKVRQPLQKVMIPVLDSKTEAQIVAVSELIKQEVNVKELVLINADEASHLIVKQIKPNFKTLGARLGKDMKTVGAEIANLTSAEIADLEKDGKMTIQGYEITTDDVRAWKAGLDEAGIACREYAVWAGGELFSQYQRMLLAAGVVQLDASQQPLNNCKWLNMEWCGIKVEGMTLHIYELCSFSSGKLLGGPNMVYPMSAIWIPMCERTTNCKGGNDNKMLTTVYFKSLDGRVWDRITDSNGILNGPNGRNTFGTGCEEHEFTIKGRMTQIIHCAEQWGYQGLN